MVHPCLVNEWTNEGQALISLIHSNIVVFQSPSHVTLCSPMDCSAPGSSVLHHLPEFAQIHVHWVSDAIYPLHPLPPSSSFAFNPSHIRVFSSESSLHIRWPKYWSLALASVFPMNIQGWFPLGLTGLIPLLSKGLKSLFQHNSKVSILQHSMTPSLDHSFIAPKRLG